MAQTPREQSNKSKPKPDGKKSGVRVERFGDVGLKYITLDKDRKDAKKK